MWVIINSCYVLKIVINYGHLNFWKASPLLCMLKFVLCCYYLSKSVFVMFASAEKNDVHSLFYILKFLQVANMYNCFVTIFILIIFIYLRTSKQCSWNTPVCSKMLFLKINKILLFCFIDLH